ncbi:GNAT family N-acetyltransferase [Halomarina pelagica]|uniref:GNAT family N-acetyltransferase n=1 Tax=Halomarina pelagica TaxID=2961599 RepID=UPI0020C47DE6|nr:GNAT family N-acetyltransferase [Halomarina sp. BND7]
MELREPTPDDADRVREVVRSAMTTSYALSPEQIETIVEAQFGDDRPTRDFEGSDAAVIVAESEVNGGPSTIAGVVVGELDGDEGEVRWLFVDPEHRGAGIGTELFETMVGALRDQGAERVRASTLEANMEGHGFFERFEYERLGVRQAEFGDESLEEYVYVEPSADEETEAEAEAEAEAGIDRKTKAEADGETGTATEADADGETDADEAEAEVDLPGTERRDGVPTATTDDGRQVYVDRDDELSGEEAPFFAAYLDEEFTERYGYYCAYCGSLDVTEDTMGRVECDECGNTHAARSGEAYDDSYL